MSERAEQWKKWATRAWWGVLASVGLMLILGEIYPGFLRGPGGTVLAALVVLAVVGGVARDPWIRYLDRSAKRGGTPSRVILWTGAIGVLATAAPLVILVQESRPYPTAKPLLLLGLVVSVVAVVIGWRLGVLDERER